ncbi:MAG: HAD family hydrolase [Candidatus Aenigmarchaeota archaeon]|nr:HAD family hydrolase [Candidatus Aenigmarchaeota archaeon]
MLYNAVFWDLDGTLYNNHGKIPANEKNVLSLWEPLSTVPTDLKYWVPYPGLADLMSQIPKDRQGIISNGYDQLQRDKLRLLGLDTYINPDLIFTSYGEAQKALGLSGHPLTDHSDEISDMTRKTQKPEPYMFEQALRATGFSAKECIMIGDDWHDILGAKSVGMPSIIVTGSTRHMLESDRYTLLRALRNFKPYYHRVNRGDIQSLTTLLIG